MIFIVKRVNGASYESEGFGRPYGPHCEILFFQVSGTQLSPNHQVLIEPLLCGEL